MAVQSDTEKMKSPFNAVPQHNKTSALDWAVFGCLSAGAVGIIKALGAESPSGVLLCLLGSVAAFGLIIYLHLRKSDL
jgi:hypothetical protein